MTAWLPLTQVERYGTAEGRATSRAASASRSTRRCGELGTIAAATVDPQRLLEELVEQRTLSDQRGDGPGRLRIAATFHVPFCHTRSNVLVAHCDTGSYTALPNNAIPHTDTVVRWGVNFATR
jgi:hypothetical protein